MIRTVAYIGGVAARWSDDGTWSVREGRTTTDGLTASEAAAIIAPAVTFPGAGIVGDVETIRGQLEARAAELAAELESEGAR